MKLIQKLKWDTAFFGKETGKICKKINQTNVEQIIQEIEKSKLELVYYFTNTENSFDLSPIARIGLEYIGTEVTLKKKMNKSSQSSRVSPLTRVTDKTENLNFSALYELTVMLSKFSRFAEDQKINQEKTKKLYEIWMSKSLLGQLADYLFIWGPVRKPQGFVTYTSKGNNSLDLILINVSELNRGKGIGTKLAKNSLNNLANQGFKKCSVNTHLKNKKAIQFYESLGFKLHSSRHIFHGHYSRGKK